MPFVRSVAKKNPGRMHRLTLKLPFRGGSSESDKSCFISSCHNLRKNEPNTCWLSPISGPSVTQRGIINSKPNIYLKIQNKTANLLIFHFAVLHNVCAPEIAIFSQLAKQQRQISSCQKKLIYAINPASVGRHAACVE